MRDFENLVDIYSNIIIPLGALIVAGLSLSWWSRKAAYLQAVHAKQLDLSLDMIQRLIAKHLELFTVITASEAGFQRAVLGIIMQISGYSNESVVFMPPSVLSKIMTYQATVSELLHFENANDPQVLATFGRATEALKELPWSMRQSLGIQPLTEHYQKTIMGKILAFEPVPPEQEEQPPQV